MQCFHQSPPSDKMIEWNRLHIHQISVQQSPVPVEGQPEDDRNVVRRRELICTRGISGRRALTT